MNVFKDYARYYNLLYRDKDYRKEANYVHGLIQHHSPGAKSLLDIGCGTGTHAFCFTELGYRVDGVDFSERMVAIANDSKNDKTENLSSQVNFTHGDVRTIRMSKKYDVVTALFHVMSYQTSNTDLLQTLETAKIHLQPDGLFLFDCWYGTGVLTDPPVVRVKRLEDTNFSLLRIAEPEMLSNRNLVNVHYEIHLTDKRSGDHHLLREKHPMRYLFLPEILLLFEQSSFELLRFEEWMTGNEPELGTWNVVVMGRNRK